VHEALRAPRQSGDEEVRVQIAAEEEDLEDAPQLAASERVEEDA